MLKLNGCLAGVLLLIPTVFLCGGEARIEPGKSVIVIPGNAIDPVRSAALELQKHLRLITGKEPLVRTGGTPSPGFYMFYVGIRPESDKKPLLREEARWLTAEEGTWIYGEDFSPKKKNSRFDPNHIFNQNVRTGTLFGVYDFLEKQLGVLWIEPGDAGIIRKRTPALTLKLRSGSWNPGRLFQRQIRSGMSWKYYKIDEGNLPENFRLSRTEFDRELTDVMFWLKRHKMGRSKVIRYGHAFTHWWEKYGKTHPEYFALQENGKRGPAPRLKGDRVKLCVSNPAVAERIVSEWRGAGMPETINVCENDSGGFCRCAECRKLDVPLAGETFDTHLTDRYVHLANLVQKLAAKYRPDVSAIFYAYSCYREPPRREKLDPRVIVGFVPSMMEYEKVAGMFEAWKKAGAEKIFLRPNDQHVNTGLPMGFEKLLFDHFQTGMKYGIIGTDYDSMHHFWPATGIADYILARAHEDPSKRFEEWEQEYASAFGDAGPEILEYYRHWRTVVWEKRIWKNRAEILKRGRYGNFRRGLMWDIHHYYRPEDFDLTDAILEKALGKQITAGEKKQIENLRNANRHARLMVLALTASPVQRFSAGRNLLDFRSRHKNDLHFFWGRLFSIEQTFGDICGTLTASKLKGFSDFRTIPAQWFFDIDRENAGQKEHWEKYPWQRIQAVWSPIMVNTNWENQTTPRMPAALKKLLENYDGIGWYAQRISIPDTWKGREISLYFGAVDESCQVYLNGSFCGERVYRNPNDWQTPFSIPIHPQIDWTQKIQTLVVRVEDRGGNGGIWKPVYLVVK